MNAALAKAEGDFSDAVLSCFSKTLKNWIFFHNSYENENITTVLSGREYQLAVLLREGKTYAQAGAQMHLSVGRIRNLVSVIYEKMNISSKSELNGKIL